MNLCESEKKARLNLQAFAFAVLIISLGATRGNSEPTSSAAASVPQHSTSVSTKSSSSLSGTSASIRSVNAKAPLPTASAPVHEPSTVLEKSAKVPEKNKAPDSTAKVDKDAASVSQHKSLSKDKATAKETISADKASPTAAQTASHQAKPSMEESSNAPAETAASKGSSQLTPKGASKVNGSENASDSKARYIKQAHDNLKSSAKTAERSGERNHPHVLLVPPPPPDTPTLMLAPGDDMAEYSPLQFIPPELLSQRKLELQAQLEDAKADLKQKQDDTQSIKDRAVQFKALLDEGVVSRREYEAATKDAGEIDAQISRLKLKVSELQTLLSGVDNRIKAFDKKTKQTATVTKSTKQTAGKKLSAKNNRTH